MSAFEFIEKMYERNVEDEKARKRDRKKAYMLFAQAFVLGLVLTAVQYFLLVNAA